MLTELNVKLEAAGKAPLTIQTYASVSDVIQQILVGRAVATITIDTTAAYRMAQLKGQLQIPYIYPDHRFYGIYLRKIPADRQAVQAAVEAIQSDGQMAEFLQKWNLPSDAADVDHKAP
jgi:polar amino acid transport system substrate-binding protein